MPSLRILELSVVRLSPRRAAAPSGPAINPLVSRRTRRLFSHGLQLRQGGAKHATLRQDYGALNEVFQFAHISRPTPTGEGVHGFSRDSLDLPPHAPRMLLYKMSDKYGNISASLE